MRRAGWLISLLLWVPISSAQPAGVEPALPAWAKAGAKVEVSWTGSWYPAEILAVEGAKAKIRYQGYGANDDEWVTAARLRQAAAGVPPSPAPSSEGKARQEQPTGRFLCQVFENNALQNQGELLLREDGTYLDVWTKKRGTWKFSPKTRELSFTGMLHSGAKVTYDPDKRQGMLTFDWGGGNQRWCYR